MTDIEDAQYELDEQEKWGMGREALSLQKVLRTLRRHEQELDQARQVIQNLRDRVKALEDAP